MLNVASPVHNVAAAAAVDADDHIVFFFCVFACGYCCCCCLVMMFLWGLLYGNGLWRCPLHQYKGSTS